MATDIYKSSTNPISGETFKTISFDKEAYVMEWSLQPKGYVPFEHIHLHQTEIFHIRKGELRITMNGVDYIAGASESVVVPPGVAHIAYNNKETVLDCIVEYKPGLDHDMFMKCLIGLTDDNYIDAKGGVSIPMMGYFLRRIKAKCMARPTAIPAPIFQVALNVFYLRGLISGWGKLFKNYTANRG